MAHVSKEGLKGLLVGSLGRPPRHWLAGARLRLSPQAVMLRIQLMTQVKPEPETVIIERIAPGGDGLGRLSGGKWVFVSRTAPGDHVELSNIENRKGVAHGELQSIVRKGPFRTDPACPISARCGGCNFIHLNLDGQRAAKIGILDDALRRVGNISFDSNKVGYIALGDGFGYRSRLRLHVGKDGTVGFLSTRSKSVVAVPSCLVAEPQLNCAIERLHKATESSRRLLRLCTGIELRSADREPSLMARLFAKPAVRLHVPSFQPLFPDSTVLVVAGSPEDSQATQSFDLPGGVTSLVPACTFTQVHRAINSRLVEDVVKAATLRNLHSFVDAYAGAGNFTLPLLAAGLTGEAIDSEPAGITNARSVARDSGLPFAGFNVGDALAQLQVLVRNRRQFDLALLDPPRTGAKDILPTVRQLNPQYIAIVACDPVSLARDLKQVLSWGAELESLTIYDMFPQTHHMETLALVSV